MELPLTIDLGFVLLCFFSLDVLPPTCYRDAAVSLLGSHTVQPVVPVLDSHRGIITSSTCIAKYHGMMEEIYFY